MKLFKKKSTAPALSRAQALSHVPVKLPGVTEENSPDGLIRLTYPAAVSPWLVGLTRRLGLRSKTLYKKLELDEMGAAVWALIGQDNSVDWIIHHFAARYRLHPREAEISVTAFLRELGRRGLIALK